MVTANGPAAQPRIAAVAQRVIRVLPPPPLGTTAGDTRSPLTFYFIFIFSHVLPRVFYQIFHLSHILRM